MITALSFDGDNTLWDFEKVMRHSLNHVRHELIQCRKLSDITVDEMIRIRNEVAQSLEAKTANLEEIRLAAFRETLRRHDVNDEALAKKLNELYLKHRFEDIELFPDVSRAFQELRKDHQLGLVSNGNSYPERCGLKDIFQFVILSQDYGINKPDPRIFAIALSAAKCRPEEILHIGDSIENDVAGAQTAGIKAVWINRSRIKNNSGISPDFEIASLLELPGILDRVNQST